MFKKIIIIEIELDLIDDRIEFGFMLGKLSVENYKSIEHKLDKLDRAENKVEKRLVWMICVFPPHL